MKPITRSLWIPLLLLAGACASMSKNSEGEFRELPEGKFRMDVRGYAIKIGNPFVRIRPHDPAWRETKFEHSSKEARTEFLIATAKKEAESDCTKKSKPVRFPSDPVLLTTASAVTFHQSPPLGIDLAFSCEIEPVEKASETAGEKSSEKK